MNKVTMKPKELKDRLDRLLSLEEGRKEIVEVYYEKENKYKEDLQKEADELQDYLRSDLWKYELEKLMYGERYVPQTFLGKLLGWEAGWVKEEESSKEVLQDVIAHLQSRVPNFTITNDYNTYTYCDSVSVIYMDSSFSSFNTRIVPLHLQPKFSKLPIDELQYMISLEKDIEVDVNWLQKIDSIQR